MEHLFTHHLFLILYGVTFYYVILWSLAKNRKSKARNERLKLAKGKAEKALIMADDNYKFNFKLWISDNVDEIVVSIMSSILLIGFDQFAIDIINKQLSMDLEPGAWIYLCGGVVGDLLMRMVAKLRA